MRISALTNKKSAAIAATITPKKRKRPLDQIDSFTSIHASRSLFPRNQRVDILTDLETEQGVRKY
jgi:hypothetical protein